MLGCFKAKSVAAPHTYLGQSVFSLLRNGIENPQGGNHFVWIQLCFTKADSATRQESISGCHHEGGRRTIFRTTGFERNHPLHGRIPGQGSNQLLPIHTVSDVVRLLRCHHHQTFKGSPGYGFVCVCGAT